MADSKKNKRPRQSLRNMLMLWFLIFSVVPLAFVTGYSVVKYEQAINQEQVQRLEGNYREIVSILNEFEGELVQKVRQHSRDNSLAYYLGQNQISKVRDMTREWLQNSIAHRLSVFSVGGRQEVALFKDDQGNMQRSAQLEGSDVFLSNAFLDKVKEKEVYTQVEIQRGRSLNLIAIAKVRNSNGRLVGYIEEIIELDKSFLGGLQKRMDLELVFFFTKKSGAAVVDVAPTVSSHDDLELYKPETLLTQSQDSEQGYFELNIRETPFGFILRPLRWGSQELHLALGASKRAAKSVLRNVNYAFTSVVGAMVVLLILLSIVISRLLLRPVSTLLNAFERVDPGEIIPEIETIPNNELGTLVVSFNELSKKVNGAQGELRQKIKELEKANQEIRDTQAKLVHSAKMASLGQLVAGVAHELNNPIGFIYSNMGHLREYSESLLKLVAEAEAKGADLKKAKSEVEFEYIVKDLPKLISSCEEGARRTRDIVLGLRNFSRLEEAKRKRINVEESLDNTLNLLSGELKNRIEVKKKYGGVPEILCYPSQLNQVFMNILANAVQAIKGEGVLTIETWQVDKKNIAIAIKDTGVGMSKETQEKIFDPFFTTKELGKGTGLGLSLSYGIIQNHNGEIQVESSPGKGTTFTLHLPI